MRPQIICFRCILRDKLGNLISSSISRDVLTAIPGEAGILSGLSKGLQNLKKGETRSISLTAEEAYGYYDPKKIILLPRNKIPYTNRLEIGQAISIISKNGEMNSYKVIQFYGELVSLDGNHPLAGQDLVFEIETLEARDASHQEIFDALNPMSSQLLH